MPRSRSLQVVKIIYDFDTFEAGAQAKTQQPMKGFSIIVALVGSALLPGCFDSSSKEINVDSIRIITVNQHAVLSEHCRKLLIQNKAGHVVDEENLYCPGGQTCAANLYDTGSTFTIIDCNAQWYVIQKSNGDLEKQQQPDKTTIPEGYLGAYTWDEASQSYNLARAANTTSRDSD